MLHIGLSIIYSESGLDGHSEDVGLGLTYCDAHKNHQSAGYAGDCLAIDCMIMVGLRHQIHLCKTISWRTSADL